VVGGECTTGGKPQAIGLKLQTQSCGFGFSCKNQKNKYTSYVDVNTIELQYKMAISGEHGKVGRGAPSVWPGLEP
jgi:hypothetical protein